MIGGKKNKTGSKKVDQISIETVISENINFKGEITGEGGIRIDAVITGNVSVNPGIILGEKATVNGNVKSDCIIIYGKLNGNVYAKELHIKNTAVINGDITVDSIEIEPGGKYNGTLKMDAPNSTMSEENSQKKTKNLKVG